MGWGGSLIGLVTTEQEFRFFRVCELSLNVLQNEREREGKKVRRKRKKSSVQWKTFPKASTSSNHEVERLGTLLSTWVRSAIWAQHPLQGVGVGRHT